MAAPTWVDAVDGERPILGEACGVALTTIGRALADAAASRGAHPMFVEHTGEAWSTAGFYALARRVARAVVAAGGAPRAGALILGENSLRWFAADWACVLSGVISAPSYVTNNVDVVAYIIAHSRAKVCFVGGQDCLEKVLAARAGAAAGFAETIVVMEEGVEISGEGVVSWEEFLKGAEGVEESVIDERMALAKPESCVKLIYTSGTTGPPKAVMISNDNIIFMGSCIVRDYAISQADTSLSYLPASHIASNALDVLGPVVSGVVVHLASPGALRGTLVDSLKRVRPTCFYAVPRVWEKVHEKMLAARASYGPVKTFISQLARRIGADASDADDDGRPWPRGTRIMNMLVFANVRAALGLDRARLIFNTAAPLQPATNTYFRSLRIKILDVYGMSEGTGSFTFSNNMVYKRGSVGKAVEGMEVKLDKRDAATGEGELCFRGRNVFLGYLGDAKESAAAMDADGFIHTGDLARMDSDGYIFITGRAKELMITSGGENVAPLLIETGLIGAMPAVSRAFALGDARKYVACLLVPHMDEDGALVGPARAVSPDATRGEHVAGDAKWKRYIEEGIGKANEGAISNVAKVKKYAVLAKDFSVEPNEGCEKGELTPTLKVRRRVVLQNYKAVIDGVYSA